MEAGGVYALRLGLEWGGLPSWLSGKESACNAGQEMQFPSLGWEDPLEEETATRSSILAWKIPMGRGA